MKRIILILTLVLPIALNGQDVKSILDRMHQVKKGETLEQIASTYNVSVEELLEANPDIKKRNKLKKGSFVCIPVKKTPIETPMVTTETEMEAEEDDTGKAEDKVMRMAVLLPLQEASDRGSKMVEFYQGMLMAADSLKKQGQSLEIHTWDCGHTASEMERLIESNSNTLGKVKVVFGPADAVQVAPLASFCKEKGIRLVLPFANTPMVSSNMAYHATASTETTCSEAASLMLKTGTDANYVLLRTNAEDKKGRTLTEEIIRRLIDGNMQYRILNIEGDDPAFMSALDTERDNRIIPDNVSIKTLNILFSKLDALSQEDTKYRISLIGYPEWQTYTNTQLYNFFKYDTYIYTTYYFNPLSDKSDFFQKSFLRNFGKPLMVSYPRYAAMGFDIAYHFLYEGGVKEEPFQHHFRFSPSKDKGDMVNTFVQLIHYTPGEKIEMIR